MRTARQTLKSRALRATTRRIRILEVLQQAPRPLSAMEIHDRLGEGGPDLATVYRNLEKMVANRIARTIHLTDERRRYEITDRGHHHHLTCTKCGDVEAIHHCAVGSIESLALREHGFRVDDHLLELFGICQRCASSQQ
jgi:Fe2+ or Zn2+ uptake regulation protein